VHSVRVECQSYLPDWRPTRPYQESYAARPSEGGVLLDLIHEIDYTGWLFGWPGTVQARRRNLGRLGIAEEEAVDLLWDTAEAGCVSMSLDYLTRPPRRLLRACGERGTLEWDGMAGTVSLTVAGGTSQIVRSSQTREEMFAAQAHGVLQACRDGEDPRLATAEDGIRALAVCEAARRASQSRGEEPVVMP
jgi:predicted dehydrogenase